MSYSVYRSHRDMFYNEATGEWATEIVTTHINSFVDGDDMDTGLMDLEESSQLDSPVHSNISQPETGSYSYNNRLLKLIAS